MVNNDILEPPHGLDLIGVNSWFIPKFTADKYPQLLSYRGMQSSSTSAENNNGNVTDDNADDIRQLLADVFLRPTTWFEYCTQVSKSNCTIPDDVAQRPPNDDGVEYDKMFLNGVYTGYFRKTDENDCMNNPSTCTGHIVEYPCSWSNFVESQAYHLHIPVESNGPDVNGGYTYGQMKQILKAMNATKSNLLIAWYSPEFISQIFLWK